MKPRRWERGAPSRPRPELEGRVLRSGSASLSSADWTTQDERVDSLSDAAVSRGPGSSTRTSWLDGLPEQGQTEASAVPLGAPTRAEAGGTLGRGPTRP